MTPWVRVYYFMSGLVYPGALGVALTWLVQGVTLYVTGAPTRPPLWNVCFAVWFTVYHSLLYSRMLDRYDTWSSEPDQHTNQAYNGYALGSDVVDSLALFLAFGTLDFQFGALSGTRVAWLFGAVVLVPISGILAHKSKLGRRRKILVALALATAVRGVWINLGAPTPDALYNWGLLLVLWVLLLLYIPWLYVPEN